MICSFIIIISILRRNLSCLSRFIPFRLIQSNPIQSRLISLRRLSSHLVPSRFSAFRSQTLQKSKRAAQTQLPLSFSSLFFDKAGETLLYSISLVSIEIHLSSLISHLSFGARCYVVACRLLLSNIVYLCSSEIEIVGEFSVCFFILPQDGYNEYTGVFKENAALQPRARKKTQNSSC